MLLKWLKKSNKVVKFITEPSPIPKSYDETYCEITLWIVRIVQLEIYVLLCNTAY